MHDRIWNVFFFSYLFFKDFYDFELMVFINSPKHVYVLFEPHREEICSCHMLLRTIFSLVCIAVQADQDRAFSL